MRFKEGDYVKIVVRETTPTDTKNGTYYPHFGGLAGTIDRIYDDEVCIKVDPDTLPDGVLKRHTDIQDSIRRKWLNGLSGEARNKLTPEEKQFQLSYMMLVQSTDLEKTKPGQPRPAEIKKLEPLNAPTDTAKPAKPAEHKAGAPEAVATNAVTAPAKSATRASNDVEAKPATEKGRAKTEKSLSSKDLEAAEEAFLKEREKALKKK